MQRTKQLQQHLSRSTTPTANTRMAGITLISATPSPFARMNRIALMEKGIPFNIRNEIPWHVNETETPKYNPLEKLPILLFDDGRDPVYDSAHIQEYIVQKYADKAPSLLPGDLDTDLKARQILTLSEGILDAFVLAAFEGMRDQSKQSELWLARQNRKIDGGLKALSKLAQERPTGQDYLLGNVLTIADIAVVCTVTQVEFIKTRPVAELYPELKKYCEKLEERQTFKETTPYMFDLKSETVV